jgi:hypothetical protein
MPPTPDTTSAAVAALQTARGGAAAPAAAKPATTVIPSVRVLKTDGPEKTPTPPPPPVAVEAEAAEAAAAPGGDDGAAPPPAAAEPPKPKPAAEPFAERFAALTREQNLVRKSKEELKAEQSKLAQERAELDRLRKELDEAKSGVLEDPGRFFEVIGAKDEQAQRAFYENMAAWVAAGRKPTPEMVARAQSMKANQEVKSEVDKLKKELEDERKAKADAAVRAETATAITQISTRIKKDEEKYGYTADRGEEGAALVFEMAQQRFKQKVEGGEVDESNKVQTADACIAEAMELAEQHFEAEAERYLTSKKTQKKITPVPAPNPKPPDRPRDSSGPSGSSSSKTLTNSLTAENTPAPRRAPPSEDEQIQLAVDALREARKKPRTA